jgi:membrane fusion protein, multidrug efflux system
MKTLSIKLLGIVLAVTIVVACKSKQDQLVDLKKQHDEIAAKIKTLEEELAAADTSKKEVKTKLVAISEIKPQVFRHFIEIQGKLDGDNNVGVSAKAMGTVEAVFVKVGDKVSKGQLLAKLDEKVLQKNYADLKSRLEFATDLYNKQKRLWDQKIGSEVQYLTAKNNKESVENAIRSLEEQIEMYHVTSPIDGTVGDASAKVGQSASPGLPLFRVISFSNVKVVADVAEAYSVKVSVGDDVTVYFPDLHRDVPATVSTVSQYINPINRTFQVEVRLKQAEPNFKANMIAVLKINDYKAVNAVVLPVNYVQNDNNGSFVLIAQANSQPVAKRVDVKVGQSYNGEAEILSGLKIGDKVISSGYLDVEDGQAIAY